MKGTVNPSCSSSSRFTVPLRPRICWKAIAPTKGGITSGNTASVPSTARPGKE